MPGRRARCARGKFTSKFSPITGPRGAVIGPSPYAKVQHVLESRYVLAPKTPAKAHQKPPRRLSEPLVVEAVVVIRVGGGVGELVGVLILGVVVVPGVGVVRVVGGGVVGVVVVGVE